MRSTVEWNITCSELNDTSIISVAEVVEQSIYEGMQPEMNSMSIELVLVTAMCNQTVGAHPGYSGPSTRRLQTIPMTEIEFTTTVKYNCIDCSDEMFDITNSALVTIVDNGSLTTIIQGNSNGVIQAVINPGSTNSTLEDSVTTTNQPTNRPTTTSKSAKNSKDSKQGKSAKA